jgi:hypothetical protein
MVRSAITTQKIQPSGIGEPGYRKMAKNDFYRGFKGTWYFICANHRRKIILLSLPNNKGLSYFRITQLCPYDS